MAKVIHVITGLSRGGAETMLVNLVRNSASVPWVISLRSGGACITDLRALGVDVWELELEKPSKFVRQFINVCLKLREIEDKKVVIAWMYHACLFATWIRYFVPCTLVWNIRQSLQDASKDKLLTRFVIWTCTFFSRKADSIVYNSRISRTMHEKLGYSKTKSVIIPNGFDTTLFQPNLSKRYELRSALNIPENAFVVGVVGRFHPVKGLDTLARAIEEILQQVPHAHFVFVGRGLEWNNRHMEAFFAIFKDYISLLGEMSATSSVYPAFDVLVNASYREGFPNVVGEAMASGVPAIVTDVGDCAYLVDNTGVVINPHNAKDIANAVRQMSVLPEYDRKALGAAARQRILDNFTISSVTQRFHELCENGRS